MVLDTKDLYVMVAGNENIKQFRKTYNEYNQQLRKLAKTYFGISLPTLKLNYLKEKELATIKELASYDTVFLFYPKSIEKFKKEHKAVLQDDMASIYIKPRYLTCLYLDKNTKTGGQTNRNNFKKTILEVLLECYGLEKVNKSLDYLTGNFIYHKAEYTQDTFNTILKTATKLEKFNTVLKNSNYIACDTEFFNVEDGVINTVIDCYMRTITFSLLEEAEDGVRHHTFEFAVEEHIDFSSRSRYDQYVNYIEELKRSINTILTDESKTLFLHNVSADLHLLANFSGTPIFQCNEIIDTITSHFVDSPHTPKGLKTIIHETDPIFYEYDKALNGRYDVTDNQTRAIASFKPKVKEKIQSIGLDKTNYKWIFLPLQNLLQYNAVDSFVTLNLGIKYLYKEGLNKLFYDHQIKFITLPFLQVEQNGLPIDADVLEEAIKFCQKGVEEYEYKLQNLGIVIYYAVKNHITKTNTILKQTITKKSEFLKKRNLPEKSWPLYETTKKYHSKINTLRFEQDICKQLIKKLKGRLADTIDDIDLPVFIEPFNFSSNPQKIDLFYNMLGLEELLLFSDEQFHTKVLKNLQRDSMRSYNMLVKLKQQQNRVKELLGIDSEYDFTNLYDQMKFISKQYDVLQYSDMEKKTDENILGNILKSFDDAPENSKKGLLFKIALYIQSAAKISKTKATYLGNYKKSMKFNTVLNQLSTHTSFSHVTRTSRQSSGSGGVNFQNVTDSKRLPKRYTHLKPYVATIKKCVKFNHTYFSDALNNNLDWDKGQFEFYDFNTVLKNHGEERVLIEFDYSQIELYIIALLGNVKYMLEVIEEGRDLHSMTAALTLGISYEAYMQMSKAEKGTTRHDSKTMNFTYSFLGSAFSAQQYAAKVYGIVKPIDFWQSLENKFHGQYSEIRPFAFKAFRKVMETGMINTITGHQRLIAQEHDNFNTILKLWKQDGQPFDILQWVKSIPYNYRQVAMKVLRKAVNTQVQGSANSYTALSTALNYNYIKANNGYDNHIASTYSLANPMPKSVLQHNVVHDAQYISCKIQDIVPTVKTYHEVMTQRVKEYILDSFGFETNIPLRIGLSIGDSWYNMSDFELEPILEEGKLIVAP